MARILIAEDNADMRELLTTILVEEGHEVGTAVDGQEALDAMEARRPDILILDVMMPGKDGFTVLKEMKTRGLRSHIKVMILTAKSNEADLAKGYNLGADHYLTKPFELDELLGALEFVAQSSKDVLAKRRQGERDKAQMLARLESLFGAE